MEKTWTAWTIKAIDPKREFFLGRYWWFDYEGAPKIPAQFEGYVCLSFRTRKTAKEYQKRCGIAPRQSRVVKVQVTMKEI